ncbi:DUF3427 domain-containing protein [Gephyromycinifex aptenodytis]|uniref:DUF3427 domain-containing protein n=1 Tax=Gephyromycinifex aptenodytis TaxID=2716227 RepID=UPI001445DF03|nr:DUF3427 domain-containing protein [Gephyromycinifex aptenodytis]
MSGSQLPPGLYEDVVTARLLKRLACVTDTPDFNNIDKADRTTVLGRHVSQAVHRALSARTPEQQVDLVARLLEVLDAQDETPEQNPRQLLSLVAPPQPGQPTRSTDRPSTPLSDAALLTNAASDPSLGAEIRRELATADEVDLLIAFVKWHGVRTLEKSLAEIKARGVPFRIVTTTYMGGTERRALDRLADKYGADIRIQYDAQRTRLHAKAWLFRRHTGLDTAYVGSSNLSASALLDGAEWNVRLSRVATPTLLQKFEATFNTYWSSDTFQPYDPRVLADRDRLDDALRIAGGGNKPRTRISLSGLQVRPFPFQEAILEALQAERDLHERHRNLVVAATGTGKTVMAALDYQRLCGTDKPSLLFVAHRAEILDQSLRTYREVLGDSNFGEAYFGGARPERWNHVFASIQSLSRYGVQHIPADAFDVVVIDEFHHAAASTYRRILDHLQPRELLGLTATPERGDGTDVRSFFGGRTAAELRLWDAIEADLLTPFHYFGIHDGTDLTRLSWTRGRYDEHELEGVYTGNDARARIVLTQVRDKIADPARMKALGFCVSVAHAHYMTRVFREAGLEAVALSGQSRETQRHNAIEDLSTGRIQAIFTADLFNEGVDIPAVDTVLFLRPTESITLFLQQLGRGLRVHPDKAVLTVLDFVGQHRAEFRLDLRFRALTRSTRKGLERDVTQGFPFLPPGCQIVLDRLTQDAVLTSIKTNLAMRMPQLVNELRAHPSDSLREFLTESGLELSDVVRSDRSFTLLRRKAGLLTTPESPLEESLRKRVRALTHVDDPERAAVYDRLLRLDTSYAGLCPRGQAFAKMLYFTLYRTGGHASYDEGLAQARAVTTVAQECRETIAIAADQTRRPVHSSAGPLAALPFVVHASYQQDEVLAGLGHAHLGRVASSFREGVLHVGDSPAGPVDAFFVTLKKSEAAYSPTTMYADYPISPTLFHWESQSGTTLASPTGQRYLSGTSTVLLFVRREKSTEFGTAPYLFLGRARYVSHHGERPIAITWRLDTAMPAELYTDTAVAM